MSGWVKIHRSLKEWEWYDDINASRLLVHLLLSVNYEDKKWKGLVVKKGSMVLSWETLSNACGLSIRQCRTAMDKLITSKEVTKEVTSRFQVVALVKWEQMQVLDDNTNKQLDSQMTDRCQADDRQMTTTKEVNNIITKEYNNTIPVFEEFLSFGLLKIQEYSFNISELELKMKYDSWVMNDWKTGGTKSRKIKNWKSTLINTLKYLNKKDNGAKQAATYNRERAISTAQKLYNPSNQ